MSVKDDLRSFVGGELARLDAGRQADDPATVATLARLRHSVGLSPGYGRAEGLYDVVGRPTFPATLKGRGDDLSAGEAAAVDALTLYALHQAGISAPMHTLGQGLGRSARRATFGPNGFPEERVRDRLHRAGSSATRTARLTNLRALIGLFHANSIGLDYVALAGDLLECGFGHHRVTHLRWTRDFSTLPAKTSDEATTGTETSDSPTTAPTVNDDHTHKENH